jgi:hypothetical protein
MEILWLAIVFYTLGLAAVLHFRPALMFNENGTWKEFGYQRSTGSRHTLFPFWLFAVVWAFLSYAVAAAISWSMNSGTGGPILGAVTAASAFLSRSDDEYDDDDGRSTASAESDDDVVPVSRVSEPARRPRGRPRKTDVVAPATSKKPRSGYYVLDPDTRDEGIRKYIYYGDDRPADD